jgi:dTDP-4-amino-4,6-dideoxygalactose transaminase
VYGVNYDATELIKYAKENGLYVVEDSAEAFYDTKYNGLYSLNIRSPSC